MSKTRKFQDYAEGVESPQSDDKKPKTLDESASDTTDLTEAVRKLTATADVLIDKADTIGVTIDGIGRWLLNEDGTIRDFTNVKLMNDIGHNVKEGLQEMSTNAKNIGERISKMPTTFHYELTDKAFNEIYKLNRNLRKERIIFYAGAIVIAIFAGFTTYQSLRLADKSEKMTQWYEENNEAILFGRYLRLHDNDHWRYWHERWVNDPGLKEDMSDYYLMEELKEKRKK